MGNILDWAKREVEIACKRENPNRKEGKFDYGCACYASALKAFKSLCEDGHSGFSIRITQGILNRLIDGMPLTPIEDTDDVWDLVYEDDDTKQYQCERMYALFKYVNKDGSVTYDCNDHCYCIDINDPNNTYSSGLARRIIHEMYPIKMPYMPGKPIKVYCEDFLYDKNNGDFDTMGIFYAVKEDNDGLRTIHINKFFREPFKNELESPNYPGWVEISEAEYMRRKASKIERGKMNFDELIGLKPNLILAELIQLFLLGDDDKIYIDVEIGGELVLEHIRIIDNKLVPYYESKIEYLYDSCSSIMTVGLEL